MTSSFRLPRPIKTLVDDTVSFVFKLTGTIKLREERLARLEDATPRSIRFKAELVTSDTLRELAPAEVAEHTSAFNDILEDCRSKLKAHIVWAAQAEVKVLKKQRKDKQNQFYAELDRLCTATYLATAPSSESPESFKVKLATFKTLLVNEDDETCDTYHNAFFYHVHATKRFTDQLHAKMEYKALEDQAKLIATEKQKAAQQVAEELELELPQAELVGNLVDRKIASHLQRINNRLKVMDKASKQQKQAPQRRQQQQQQHQQQQQQKKKPNHQRSSSSSSSYGQHPPWRSTKSFHGGQQQAHRGPRAATTTSKAMSTHPRQQSGQQPQQRFQSPPGKKKKGDRPGNNERGRRYEQSGGSWHEQQREQKGGKRYNH